MNTSNESLNVLVIGGGGREHAIIRAVSRSPRCGSLYCAPGNAGIAEEAHCVDLAGHAAVIAFCRDKAIDLVMIGPEQPLVDGLSDALREAGLAVFGPSQAAARLEASKAFTKAVCDAASIPTAGYASFTDLDAALQYCEGQTLPLVIKADGLAAGKGVIICETPDDVEATLKAMFTGQFGEASKRVVIEDYLIGEELSVFALCDGKQAWLFGSAQDHKAAYDGDKGPNTGGMGAYSPAPVMTQALEQKVMDRIIAPAVLEMADRGTPYQGMLFAGLMVKDGEPKLIEFNARLGDPEAQVLLSRLADDCLELCYNAACGELPHKPVQFREEAALCVVVAAEGYPGPYEKGTEIRGLDEADGLEGVTIYHAGTTREDGRILASGGRVLGVTALAPTVKVAQGRAYAAVDRLDWPQSFCRRDIGWRAIKAIEQEEREYRRVEG